MKRPWGAERKSYLGLGMWVFILVMFFGTVGVMLFKSTNRVVAPMASEPEKCRFYSDEAAVYHRCELNGNCMMTVEDMRRQNKVEMAKKWHCDLAGPERDWPN